MSAGDILWTARSGPTTLITLTGAIADGGLSASGNATIATLDNTSTKHRFVDLELYLGASATPTKDSVQVWLVPRLDGTNALYGADGARDPASAHSVGPIQVPLAAGQWRNGLEGIGIGPYVYDAVVKNGTGVNLPSGTTLKAWTYSEAQAQS